jgi:four helix bundle protein
MHRDKWGFENLEVWQLFLKQNKILYTHILPHDKIVWDIIRHMRRAMVSVGLNIAEGYTRTHNREKIQFLNIAKASMNEVKACLLIIETLSNNETELSIINTQLSQLSHLDIKMHHLLLYFKNKK